MNTITHFEIPSSKIEKSKEFYSKLFNWQFQFMEEMNYMMFSIPNADGTVTSTGGGIVEKKSENQPIINYIVVEDIDLTAKKIVELGGKITVPKTDVPGMGSFVHFADIDGNIMAIWQNLKK